jgi:hypothetical protein
LKDPFLYQGDKKIRKILDDDFFDRESQQYPCQDDEDGGYEPKKETNQTA